MVHGLNKILPFRHINEPANEIVEYIDSRRRGTIKSLQTKWPKFNNTCMGGIEPNAIYTIAGISGSGKSSFLNTLETDLFDLNPTENFIILSFSLEMLSSRQIGRKLSYKLKKTTQELYSGIVDSVLSDSDFERVRIETELLKKYQIYYVDIPGTVDDISNTIYHFKEVYAKDKWLIVTFDHTLLIKNTMGIIEREVLFNLQRVFMELKKHDKCTIIQLTQMNREIESSERINNPSLHFPMRKDIYGSDSIFQASDVLIVLHRPEILGIEHYSLNKFETKDMIFAHFLKIREGEPKIISFKNNLKYNTIEEYNPYSENLNN